MLGPLLCIGFNSVLDVAVPDSVHIVRYVDDMLIIIKGKNWTRNETEAAVAAIIDEVHRLGLDIAAQKKKGVWLHGFP